MPQLTLNGRTVDFSPGETILDAARRAGVAIPTLCHWGETDHRPSCMVCVVQVDGRSGLVPACSSRAEPGMSIRTDTAAVIQSRRTSIELLLSDHAGDCVAPCTRTCPAGFDAAAMLAALANGDIAAARRRLEDSLPLATTLGFICAGYCERACHRRTVDAAVAIGDLHGYLAAAALADGPAAVDRPVAAFDASVSKATSPASAAAADVAIIGGGPAGIVAAWDLSRLGYASVIYETASRLGGTLRQVEALGRLPAGLVDREFSALLPHSAGVKLQATLAGQGIGSLDLPTLRRRHRAIVVATGALAADAPLRTILADAGATLTPRGLQVDRQTMTTSVPGLFAAGAVTGAARNLALYVGQARRAAAAVADFLARGDRASAAGPAPVPGAELPRQQPARWASEEPSPSKLVGLTEEDIASLMASADAGPRLTGDRAAWDGSVDPAQPPAPRALPAESDANREARRCLQCSCEKLMDCQLRELALELNARPGLHAGSRRKVSRDASHPLVTYDSGKCIQCGICLAVARRQQEGLGLAFIGRGFQVRTAAPFGEKLDAALRVAAREAAAACPTGALAVKSRR